MKKPSKKTTALDKLEFTLPNRKNFHETFMAFSWKKNPTYHWDNKNVYFTCYFLNEPTCCGFDVLGDFHIPTKEADPYIDVIAEKLNKSLIKWNRPYFAAYIPDTKEYERVRTIMEKAGFKKGLSLPSYHNRGRYTNSRWEWFKPSKPVKTKGL